MRIAVVIDALDTSRQIHSDAGETFTKVAEALAGVFRNVEIRKFSGGQATSLLAGVSSEDWDALVLASNSIRHTDGSVRKAVAAHGENISQFIESGGGLLVLHQFDSNLSSIPWPEGVQFSFEPRDTRGASKVLTIERPSEMLMNFPLTVELGEELVEKGSQLGDIVSWMRCDFPDGAFQPVLSLGPGQVVLARSSNSTDLRVVISALPLDWHGAVRLLANIVTFVASGSPRQIIWTPKSTQQQFTYNPEKISVGVFQLPIGALGAEAVEWAQNEGIDQVLSDGLIEEEGISTNGLTLSVTNIEDHRFRFFGESGTRPERQLEHELEGLDFSQVGSNYVQHPYILRNVVTSLALTARKFPRVGAWNPQEDEEFKNRFTTLEFDEMTVTSALASLQTALMLGLGKKTTSPIVKRVKGLARNASFSDLAEAIASTASGAMTFDGLLEELFARTESLTRPELARALEWVAFFHHYLELSSDPAELGKTVTALVHQLADFKLGQDLEMSVDEQCAVTMALVTSSQISDERSHDALGQSLSGIRRFLASRTSPEQMSLRLRAATSVALARQAFPNPVEELKAGLLRIAADDKDWKRRVEPLGEESSSSRMSEQVAFLTQKNASLRNELNEKRSVWTLGALSAWLLSAGVFASLIIGWVQIFRFEALADIFAIPLGIAALWVLNRLLTLLDRNHLTPQWLSGLLGKIPWFK